MKILSTILGRPEQFLKVEAENAFVSFADIFNPPKTDPIDLLQDLQTKRHHVSPDIALDSVSLDHYTAVLDPNQHDNPVVDVLIPTKDFRHFFLVDVLLRTRTEDNPDVPFYVPSCGKLINWKLEGGPFPFGAYYLVGKTEEEPTKTVSIGPLRYRRRITHKSSIIQNGQRQLRVDRFKQHTKDDIETLKRAANSKTDNQERRLAIEALLGIAEPEAGLALIEQFVSVLYTNKYVVQYSSLVDDFSLCVKESGPGLNEVFTAVKDHFMWAIANINDEAVVDTFLKEIDHVVERELRNYGPKTERLSAFAFMACCQLGRKKQAAKYFAIVMRSRALTGQHGIYELIHVANKYDIKVENNDDLKVINEAFFIIESIPTRDRNYRDYFAMLRFAWQNSDTGELAQIVLRDSFQDPPIPLKPHYGVDDLDFITRINKIRQRLLHLYQSDIPGVGGNRTIIDAYRKMFTVLSHEINDPEKKVEFERFAREHFEADFGELFEQEAP